MRSNKKILSLFTLIALIHLFSTIPAAETMFLFSDEEGEILNLSPTDWQKEIQQSVAYRTEDAQPYTSPTGISQQIRTTGPIVSILDPTATGQHCKAVIPLRLLVFFKSHQAPIDIETLTIKGKRGIFALDITDRLKPFLREADGDENADYVIEGEIAKLRSGRYQVVLSLADVQGNFKESSIFLEVTK